METEQLVKETYAQWQQCQAAVAQLLPYRHTSKSLQSEVMQLRQELTQQCQRNGELSTTAQDLRTQQEELLLQLKTVQHQLAAAAQENTQLSEKVAQHDTLFLHKSIEADKWQSQYTTAQETINQLHTQLLEVITQEKHDNALNDLRSQLTAEHNKAMIKALHDNEEQIKHIKTLHQRDIDQITLTHTVVMQQLAQTHQQNIDQLQQKLTEENTQLKVDIEVMRRERDIAMQTPPAQAADTMAQERKKLAETLQKTEKLSADIQQMLNKFNISSAKHVIQEV